MSRIFVAGLGAVSPAGWKVAALREALDQDEPLPTQTWSGPAGRNRFRARLVPNPAVRPEFLAHPRLRRASPITHYVVAAALEAMAGLLAKPDPKRRLGLVVCLQCGCVNYSCRFFEETLKDPATASPLLFPETVYAAPTSHVAAFLGNVSLANSLVGDPATFLQGISLGVQWLEENRVDACLVIGAEETNWILADALWHLERPAVLTAGAGAVTLCRDPELSIGVELAAITDVHTYSRRNARTQAARAMREQLRAPGQTEKIAGRMPALPEMRNCSATVSETARARMLRNSRRGVIGPARASVRNAFWVKDLMAAAAWQCVAACDAVAGGRFTAANVSLVGSNQQAMGARFVRADSSISHLSPGGSPGNIRP